MGKKLIFIIIIECLLSCTGFSSFSKPENSDSIVVCYFKGNIIRSASVPCSLAFSRAKYLRTDTIIRLKPNEFNKIKYALENTRKVGKENDCESKFLISMDSISVCICDFNRVYNKNDEQLSFDLSIIYLVKWKSGFYNYILTVKSNDSARDAAILYCMDSNSYSTIEGVKGYGFIKFDQISWYRENSNKFTAANGGKPVQSFAFFHIPLPEYSYAVEDQNAVMVGTRMEQACSPKLNSGMFAAMKENGDVKGIFVGHDHDNDYAVYWNNILLAYGRYSGGNTVYNHLSNGARVIELTENSGYFTTWITLEKSERINKVVCPDDFIKDKNKNM